MRTFELEINDNFLETFLSFLKKYPSENFRLYEVEKWKISQPLTETTLGFVSDQEQKDIIEELNEPDK